MKSKIVIEVEIDKTNDFKEVTIDSQDSITVEQLALACQHLMILVTQQSSKGYDETINDLTAGARSFKNKDVLH